MRGSGCVENDDPESAAVEGRTGTGRQRAVERVGVVRHEHNREMLVLAPHIVNQAERRHLCAWAEHLFGGLQERPHLGIAVTGTPDGVAVDTERDVVEKQAAIHVRHIDQAAGDMYALQSEILPAQGIPVQGVGRQAYRS